MQHECLGCGERRPLINWYYCGKCHRELVANPECGERYMQLDAVRALIQDEERRRYQESLARDLEESLVLANGGDLTEQPEPPPDFERLISRLWFDSGRVLNGDMVTLILTREGHAISRRTVFRHLKALIEEHGKPTKERDALYWSIRQIMEETGDADSGVDIIAKLLAQGVSPEIQAVYDRMSAIRCDLILEEYSWQLRN